MREPSGAGLPLPSPYLLHERHTAMKGSTVSLIGLLVAVSAAQARPPFPLVGEISPARFEVLQEKDQKALMRDGARLTIDVFRPRAEGRFPAILYHTPYGRGGGTARARRFAARGYVVVTADSRGRFESGGEWDPFSALHKCDGHDLVEWMAKQSWCTGSVGTFGLSYMGWQQWWTASQSPPALKAIVPEVAPPDQFYNCPYQNGIFVCWMMDWAGMMSGRQPHRAGPGPYGGFAVNREASYRQLPYIDFDKSRRYLPTSWWRQWMLQNTAGGDYWRAIAYQTPESYARIKVPSLSITGWFDANFPGSPMNYRGMKQHGGTPEARRPRLVVGPWEHSINSRRVAAGVDFGPQAIIDWDGYVCRWFDHHLKGIDNHVLDDPPVHVFVMGRNQWRSAGDWPFPEAVPTRYYLHSKGNACSSAGNGTLDTTPPATEKPDTYTYDPNDPTPSPAFANGHIDGPRDVSQAAARPDVLVYSTPVLQQDVEVVGPITAQLFAATSAGDTDWMVRLVDVHPDGRALFLAEGVMRARHRDGRRNGAFCPDKLSTIEPNRVYPYTIEFWRPTGNVFARGHRIRVEISSSYYPYYLRNLNTGEDNLALATRPVVARQTIRHDADHPSCIVLPVIPPKNSAPEFRRDTGPAAGPARQAGFPCLGQLRQRRSEDILGSRWGVSCHWIADEHPLTLEARLEHVSALGLKWALLVPDWDRIEQEKGKYDWNTPSHRLDDIVTGLLRRKITPIIQIYGGNRLYMQAGADPNRRQLADAARLLDDPTVRQAWHRFLEALVRRYQPHVKVWEIWNEPNGPWFWQKPASVQDYGRMVKAAAGVIKRVQPQAVILAGSTANVPLDYLEAFLASEGANSFDNWSVHPYGALPEAAEPRIRVVQESLRRHGKSPLL